MLDKEIPGMDNWMHFAHKFGLSKEICDSLKPTGTPSPTRALLEHIVQVDPGLTVKRFIEVLIKMERMDVVDALGKIIYGNTYIKNVKFHIYNWVRRGTRSTQLLVLTE